MRSSDKAMAEDLVKRWRHHEVYETLTKRRDIQCFRQIPVIPKDPVRPVIPIPKESVRPVIPIPKESIRPVIPIPKNSIRPVIPVPKESIRPVIPKVVYIDP
ncbi:hypothetical protein TNIN_265451 [Trichonephila inaurata madagascariensis]|uniref:Uncharacterized protein n=1 Tax=Trichonephila inaurata madagascariensis TaxID=2747483 RepID=A0A8X6YM94_9ARAC|nr:hypothetical protein TNIN_265451 [Trichonephila inaurata madagascariensis]